MTISDRLKKIIENKELKITEFASICDMPYGSVQNYIRGERLLGTGAVIKICKQLHINPSWLLLGEGDMDEVLHPQKEPQTAEEIDKIMKDLNPEQRQEILTRSMEMKKMNDLEKKTERLEKCLEELEGKLEGKI